MSVFQAIVLGVVQGLTEFLPVSSSGHLVLFQHLFGLTEPNLFFDVSVHVGTLTAVVLFFRREIAAILVALGRVPTRPRHETAEDPDVWFALLIIIGSVPTAILGLGFHNVADRLFGSLIVVGCALIVTGTILYLTRRVASPEADRAGLTVRDALVVGTVQGLAIIPGISRSGSTIAVGLFLGKSRETAARYSFLLSIPAILGAEILAVRDVIGGDVQFDGSVLAGTLAAFITGYGALVLLLYVIRQGRLYRFAPYCWLLGAAVLIMGWR